MEWCYHNQSDALVVLRSDEEDFYMEKVAFPFDMVSFEAPVATKVFVWGYCNGSVAIIDSFIVGKSMDPKNRPAT
ncbi:MAG: hypothetical protein TH68_09295 [Candidatus Synechococcus spongiarum 142]|uniref:DUF1830 domain-containing protein n=1 Tax=Candidatus Synechococcus spongiarum 142 TaxID=1608213 RepID=A0A6N3X2B0_9SYNE|nr:MAG: hypothetical protein TH68_09295 [Candidatus Synechococcus spongiarum 142]